MDLNSLKLRLNKAFKGVEKQHEVMFRQFYSVHISLDFSTEGEKGCLFKNFMLCI